MAPSDFDKVADEYSALHNDSLAIAGEGLEYFAEYKIRDLARHAISEYQSKKIQLLDFGSGIGNSVPFVAKYLPHAEISCLDASKRSIEIARSRFEGAATFIQFDGGIFPFADASYDVVFSACVFHHIDSREHATLFNEIYRVMKPGGLIMIYEHNPFNPLTRHAVNTCPFDNDAVLITASKLNQTIQKAGFTEVTTHYRVFFPRCLRALRRFEDRLRWLPLGAQYYVVGKKTDEEASS